MLDSRTLRICGSELTAMRFSTTAEKAALESFMNAAPDGSVIQRDAPRADLIAFEIKDKITKPDIEWMSSITDNAMQAHGKIDMLLIMSNYEGSDLGAKFDGYAKEVKVRSVAHIRRYVVVGAPTFARAMIKLSGAVVPVETKTFDLAEEAAAWAYLAEAGPATT
ncbi:STAS/SEC14 domain-containing protein [Methylobacterium sp. P31]